MSEVSNHSDICKSFISYLTSLLSNYFLQQYCFEKDANNAALWGIDVPIRAPRFQQNMDMFVHGFIGFVFV